MEYELIRSGRRTLAIEVRSERVIVRAPLLMPQRTIDTFVREHEAWIRKKTAQNIEKAIAAERAGRLTEEDIKALTKQARELIPQRAAFYAGRIGVRYNRITIRSQRTKWGSCSSKGNLSFNCLLMLTPPEVIDSVVVHELCHLKQMNHSKQFYAEVRKAYPDYDKWNKWLKRHGAVIMQRLP